MFADGDALLVFTDVQKPPAKKRRHS
jgi:hypothetical protein